MLCPDCNTDEDYLGRKGYCHNCNRRIVKRSWGKNVTFRLFDMLKFHRHDWQTIESVTLKNRHGTFSVNLLKCSKCKSRHWTLTGHVEEVEAWERQMEVSE